MRKLILVILAILFVLSIIGVVVAFAQNGDIRLQAGEEYTIQCTTSSGYYVPHEIYQLNDNTSYVICGRDNGADEGIQR